MKIDILSLLIFAVFGMFVSASAEDQMNLPASLTIQVVDEDGKPIGGADTGATFIGFDLAKGAIAYKIVDGVTDGDGVFQSKGETVDDKISYGVAKPGYYEATNLKYAFKKVVEGRWEPWNPTVRVVMKRIVNPIPMYAKHVETKIPVDKLDVGYDLEIGDWVSPYGKGKVADFKFNVDRKIASDRDYDAKLVVSFSNQGDGLLPQLDVEGATGGLFPLRTAFEKGYESERAWHSGRSTTASEVDRFSDTPVVPAYFFRVRTQLDEKGNVKSALYGKIYRDIKFYVGTKAPKAGVGFTYYLNPVVNDRNVEFDPQRNLFGDLRGTDRVTAP